MHIRTSRGRGTRTLASLAALILLAACGGGSSSDSGGDTEGASTGDDGIAFDESTEDSSPFDDDAPLDDDGDGSGTDDDGPNMMLKCTNVDFIFVVDNSASMKDEQQYLAAAVPGFVSAMQNALPDVQSFRVGVVDTDSYPALGTGVDDPETPELEGNPLEGCPTDDPSIDCSSCDYQLGAFLTKPNSATDPALSCEFSSGASYMDGKADTFGNEFGCAAIVGTTGNPVEQQASALLAAVSAEQNGPDGCNDGFVRDDALLVFLMISDEEDSYEAQPAPQGGSLGEPAEWFDAIVAAKDGKDTNIVALGLLGGSPKFPDCGEPMGTDGAEQSSRLVDFIERFPSSFVGSVCSEGYSDFFQDALITVSEGCQNFIP